MFFCTAYGEELLNGVNKSTINIWILVVTKENGKLTKGENVTMNTIMAARKEMVGYKYRHFKGGLYLVTELAVHTETGEIMVIYKSIENPDLIWSRPLDMFISEVDHEKYPDVKQALRFERIEEI